MIHNLKIKEQFADAIASGDKTFEVRYNDRGFQKGDYVTFTVIDDWDLSIQHVITDKLYKIIYVLNVWPVTAGYVVFSIREVTDAGGIKND